MILKRKVRLLKPAKKTPPPPFTPLEAKRTFFQVAMILPKECQLLIVLIEFRNKSKKK